MKTLVSFAEAKELDKAMEAAPYNLSGVELMESASRGIATSMFSSIPDLQDKLVTVLFLVGNGKNGMDALTIARYFLFAGFTNVSILIPEKKSAQTESKLRQVSELCKNIYTYDNCDLSMIAGFKVIIDGILGIGADRPIHDFGFFMNLMKKNPEALVISIDVASGIFWKSEHHVQPGSYTNIIQASHTFSILPLKYPCFFPGFRKFCGLIHEIRLVFPTDENSSSNIPRGSVALIEDRDLCSFVPPMLPTSHKYDRGSVLIYSGSIGSTGAPLLAAKAAIASGAGLVTLRVPDEVYPRLAGALTGIIIEPDAFEDKRRHQAILCGPGWTIHESNKTILQRLWSSELPLVVDASALSLINPDFLASVKAPPAKEIVFTPHLGEMARLLVTLGMASTYDNAFAMVSYDTKRISGELASKLNATIIVKGACTWIATPKGKYFVYDGCEPGLAVGGSGDVLAGIVVSLLGRGASADEASCGAVLAHGMAGKKLVGESGFFDASELAVKLSSVMYGVSV